MQTGMYDVIYLDASNHTEAVGRGLRREAACELARTEARRRRVGRMFLAGSEPHGEVVLIVESGQRAA